MTMRRERLTWEDVDRLIGHLIPQFSASFEAMVLITRGGIVPGGLLAESLGIESVLTASVDFPYEARREAAKLLVWPQFIQFPEETQLAGKSVLVVDDVWGSGRTITAVKNRVQAAGGRASTCVLHFNPYRNLFGSVRPDYYAAETDAYILYPWEGGRGLEKVLLDHPES